MTDKPGIHGYDFGAPASASSPLSLEELRQIEASAGWTEQDAEVLLRHRDIFLERAEDMVDCWRSVIAACPHLAAAFLDPDGKPDEDYKAKARARFIKWVRDVSLRPHDRAWLDYQEEIGLRHTPAKKNRTDDAHTPKVVPLRYLLAFSAVAGLTALSFFKDQALAGEELQRLEQAWMKAVILHVTRWSRPYAKDGLW